MPGPVLDSIFCPALTYILTHLPRLVHLNLHMPRSDRDRRNDSEYWRIFTGEDLSQRHTALPEEEPDVNGIYRIPSFRNMKGIKKLNYLQIIILIGKFIHDPNDEV